MEFKYWTLKALSAELDRYTAKFLPGFIASNFAGNIDFNTSPNHERIYFLADELMKMPFTGAALSLMESDLLISFATHLIKLLFLLAHVRISGRDGLYFPEAIEEAFRLSAESLWKANELNPPWFQVDRG
ncbi:MAG: hypothetical protein JNM27_05535 [Leptospirales bacterium]|nr:hypothetical protein [Leptospirales bacterium]